MKRIYAKQNNQEGFWETVINRKQDFLKLKGKLKVMEILLKDIPLRKPEMIGMLVKRHPEEHQYIRKHQCSRLYIMLFIVQNLPVLLAKNHFLMTPTLYQTATSRLQANTIPFMHHTTLAYPLAITGRPRWLIGISIHQQCTCS